jgi:voltage-gated potassium channel
MAFGLNPGLRNRLLLALMVPLLLVFAGTLGYTLIEGWSLFDSLYMTVITITTVGYLEVHEMSAAGRSFTMILLLGGVFTLFYTATEVIRAIVSGEVIAALGRRRMELSLAGMHDHLIVCGFGRMGRLVCQDFSARGMPFVVIDRRPDLLEVFHLPHGIALHGDATSDEVLRQAGVARARSLIAVLGSDADNLYIVMSARLLNDRLFIVARAEDERSEQKLIRAGANRAISPYLIGGTRVAQAVLRPNVVDFIELATRTGHLELQIEEAQIHKDSVLTGTTLKDSRLRRELGLIIVAIRKGTGKMLFNPPPESVIEADDILIALGDRKHLDELDRLAAAPRPVKPA